MKRNRFFVVGSVVVLLFVSVLAARAVLAEDAGPPSGKGIPPIVLDDNPDCGDAGYGFGFKVNGDDNGIYYLTATYGSLTGGAPSDPGNSITISNSNGTTFDWSATLGIDAVIVKGGNNANLYEYDPEETSDSGLHPPINSNTGQPYGISHIEFCYDYEVVVSKTAETAFTRTYNWTITKAVVPDEHWLFAGGSADSTYGVNVSKTGYTDSGWAVSGTITIHNPTPFDVLVSVSDVVSPAIGATVACPASAIVAGGTLVCTYITSLPDGAARTNTATVSVTTPAYVGGGTATAAVTFGDPTTEVNATINVQDVFDGAPKALGSTSVTHTFTYPRTFTCPTDASLFVDGFYSFTKNNTASIVETGQSANASVEVNCYAPIVSKDAHTSLTRTWNWEISKDVDPDEHWLFAGEDDDSTYTVSVDKTGSTDSDWAVEGAITVYNPHPTAAMTVALSDVITPGDIAAVLDCGGSLEVQPLSSATCGYSADLPNADERDNTATAALNGASFSGAADVEFDDPEITEEDEEITVTDTFMGTTTQLGTATDDHTFPVYDRTFACSDDPDDYTAGAYSYQRQNTAEIVETGQTDSETVTVHCYAPVVSKTADPSYTRTYEWELDKSGDQSNLTLALGQSFLVNYTVTVDVSGTSDDDFGVSGEIKVANLHPSAAMNVTISDSLAGASNLVIDCGGGPGDTSLTVPAGDDSSCDYSAALPDKADRTNYATATLNGIDFTASKAFSFGDPTSEVDECIQVDDDKYGSLGTACADDSPKTLQYSLTVGPYEACGTYEFTNTATFETNDTGATGGDSWTVIADVPCQGCTLTIGYWKNHAGFGPQPDMVSDLLPVWLGAPGGAKSVQVTSAGQAVELLNKSGEASNGINKLYAQLLGAKLNIADGADGSAVSGTISTADAFLANYNAGDWGSLTKAEKKNVINWAATLDSYNNGLTGPGHCTQ